MTISNGMAVRGDIIARRTYCRPLDAEGTVFETWDQVCERVGNHQRWLWERALTHMCYPAMRLKDIKEDFKGWVFLDVEQEAEISELVQLFKDKKAMPSGRTLWLGGTDVAKSREASMFNCSNTNVETVYDVVDILWLLLQGCGVGFKPVVGTLTGFSHVIPEIEIIRTTRTGKGGCEENTEWFEDGVWCIQVGDSAEAWAKSIGKLLAGKYKADKLVFDFSQIRPAGERLKGYGWISSGDDSISVAYPAIANILNNRAGSLLSKIDMLDICNWLGTILSSRRSAEIALVDYGSNEWYEFAEAKNEWWLDNPQRVQSNNSLVFNQKPSKDELSSIFELMVKNGGSEPGFINGEAARNRAPWFQGINPCAEILLPNKGFCNLVDPNASAFIGDSAGFFKAIKLLGRANYRQTIVDFRDGILQESWHLNNEFLHLCGVGMTGVGSRDDMTAYDWKQLRYAAVTAAYNMAEELDKPRPANITTIKPSGTSSKVLGSPEGVHIPLGRYIFNWVKFSVNDPLCAALRSANYREQEEPTDKTSTLFCLPVRYDNIKFSTVKLPNGREVEVNLETAIEQLERYKKLQVNWCDQNVSNTISYSVDEVPAIMSWLLANWDIYVGVSFLFRADPTKTAEDLGYKYLPQEVQTKEEYDAYVSTLLDIDFSNTNTFEELAEDECAGGVCPVK